MKLESINLSLRVGKFIRLRRRVHFILSPSSFLKASRFSYRRANAYDVSYDVLVKFCVFDMFKFVRGALSSNNFGIRSDQLEVRAVRVGVLKKRKDGEKGESRKRFSQSRIYDERGRPEI